MRHRVGCADDRDGQPCALCLAHGDDCSQLMVANWFPVLIRNEHGQRGVQRGMLWLIDQTLNEYDRSKA
jgi:hypothetical protein